MQSRANLSRHRRARLEKWAMLWLLRLAACLAQVEAIARPAFDIVRRLALTLLILRVADAVRPPAAIHYGPKRRLSGNARRAMIGARLRRMLRARKLGERITKLLDLLRDLNAHQRRLIRRLARGLTRMRPILAAPAPAQAAPHTLAPKPMCADTS